MTGTSKRHFFKGKPDRHGYLRLAPPPVWVKGRHAASLLKLIFFGLLLLPLQLKAAPNHHRSAIPAKQTIAAAPTATVTLLTQHLTAHCTTDSQKACAIFKWITDHIGYDVCDFHDIDTPYNAIPAWPPQWGYSAYDTWHNNQVARLVLERRIGICDGYARLFKAMCDAANIEAVCIEGYARRERGIGLEFESNHAWNAVRINGIWRLLDATWASGYCDTATQKFTRRYNGKYWMTPPDEMLQDHYPERAEWALVKVLPPVYAFFREPLHHPPFLTSCVSSYLPANGLLNALPGQTCVFSLTGTDTVLIPEITFRDNEGHWHLADGQPGEEKQLAALAYLYDQTSTGVEGLDTLPHPPTIDSLAWRVGLLDRIRPDSLYTIKGNTYTYRFKVPRAGARYVYISCNGKLLLTYAARRPAIEPPPPRTAPRQ